MAYLVNFAITDTFILRDNDHVAISGLLNASALWTTKEAYDVGTPATTATLTITSIGNGEYSTSFVPTTPSSGSDKTWTAHVIYDDGAGIIREFSQTYQVTAVAAAVAPAYTTLGDIATVQQMMRADTTVTFDDDVTDRLTALQAMVSEQLQFKLGRTFGDPVSDTTLLLYAGNSPTLWLPRPARSITSVTAWGDVAGDTFSNGTLLSTDDYVYDPVDHDTGLIHGLRLIGALWPSGGSWGTDDALGFGVTPVEVVGDFSDTDDDAYVPADVNYAANFLILALYRREQGIPYSMVTANGLEIPLDPWKDSVVKDVIERYQVSGRDWQLVVG